MKKWFLMLLLLALPATGFATQENTVVVLPAVAPLAMATAEPAADYSSAPIAEYYAWNDSEPVDEQAPRMTAAEAERAAALLKDYQAGARPEQDVLNKLENVAVGVYTLNPADYEGETLFTLLPVGPLTDEEILEIIDAFARSGQTFDPGALTYKNCMRGGGIEATRFFQNEERTRRTALRDLYIRMGVVSETPYTPLVTDDGLGMVTLDTAVYSGLDVFLFLPMRAMTDDELLSYEIYSETGDPAEYGNYAAYEKQLRLELKKLLSAPLVMTLETENTGVMGDYNVNYDDERIYYASFFTPDGVYYSGYLNTDTSAVVSAWLWWPDSMKLQYSDLHLDPFDEKWLGIAEEAVLALRSGSDVKISVVESRGEIRLQSGGYGVMVVVSMEDGSYYQFQIAYQNEAPTNGVAYESHASNPERMYGDGRQE